MERGGIGGRNLSKPSIGEGWEREEGREEGVCSLAKVKLYRRKNWICRQRKR